MIKTCPLFSLVAACSARSALAREAERQRRRELAEQFNGVQKRALPPTVTRASKLWMEKRVGLAASTRVTYDAALLHVKAKLGTLLVCEVTARDVAEYQKRRLAESAAGATINKEIACYKFRSERLW